MSGGDYDERTPLMRHTDDQDDDDEGNIAAGGSNETTEFEPGASSTPAPNGNQRQTTMNRHDEQPSWVELPEIPGGLSSTTFAAESELGREFPFAGKSKLKYMLDDKDRLKVGLLGKGRNNKPKPYYSLIIEIPGKRGEYQIKSSKRSFKSP